MISDYHMATSTSLVSMFSNFFNEKMEELLSPIIQCSQDMGEVNNILQNRLAIESV
jgi:hypothetical protein